MHRSSESATQKLPLKVFVHLAYAADAEKHSEQFKAGNIADPVPYGFHHAELLGCELRYSKANPESFLSNLFRRGLQRFLGFDIVHAYRNREQLFSADVIWTMEERQFLAILCLDYLRTRSQSPPVIAQTVWLFNRWEEYPWWRRTMLSSLLRKADVLTVHSKKYLEIVRGIVPGANLRLLRFGISTESFPLHTEVRLRHEPIRILSLGNDPTRDWGTLLAAVGNDNRFAVTVVSKNVKDEIQTSYRNLSVPRFPSMRQFIDLYRWADLVVIPMVPNAYSGITVALEATRLGVPVVCSRTGGVPTYLDENECIYVPPEDPEALRDTILNCTDDLRRNVVRCAQNRFSREDYSTAGMAKRYVQLSYELLSTRGRA